jgi:cysteine desulfurase family protein
MKMINFDNAATTFPKPATVQKAVHNAVISYGNSGRGGHSLSMAGGIEVYKARETAAEFFGGEPENIIFTGSTTLALNFAIKGVMDKNSHIIISSMEHNSVSRPIIAENYDYSIIPCTENRIELPDEIIIENFKKLVKNNTRVCCICGASNVTGRIFPFRKIGEICREKGIILIVDVAQAAGVIPINLNDNIDIICSAGHKGLYGVTGTGLLVTNGKYTINPIIQGGTGSNSLDLKQPLTLPDALESGTLNIPGIISVRVGIEFVKNMGTDKIFLHENQLCRHFIKALSNRKNVKIYRNENLNYVPIVSFNLGNRHSEDVANELNKKGFALRAGLHCAALAHKSLGTENGTIRFAPSVFNNIGEVNVLINSIDILL